MINKQLYVITMWVRTLILFCVICFADTNADKNDFKIVNIAQGAVKGYKDAEHGIYEFKNIPYATVPTGRDKFKAPRPPPLWTETFNAVDRHIVCPQVKSPDIQSKQMQEDCLVANVYSPDTEEKNLPVVFYVHGGAFQVGYGDKKAPKTLIKENNIIYVTFNYRLGAHGFLSLGTEGAPGNAGMKDQVAALRWVKDNIASFGGNPDDITLEGSSAGSASVDLLMLSKSTEGLFNKVIPESGANTACWAIQPDPLHNAKRFAKYFNFTNLDDIDALEDFYQTASFDVLASNAFTAGTDSTFVFSPCVERASSGEVFLDKSPVDIIKSGEYPKVPILYGTDNMEGLLRQPLFKSWKSKMNEKFSDFLPADLKFDSVEEKEKVAKKIKEFYFGDKPVEESNILKYFEYFTESMFTYPMLRAVKYHVEAGHNQVYLYEYSFVDANTPIIPHTNAKGANHCDQTAAVFNVDPARPKHLKKTEEFENMSTIMRNIWSNFVKTGTPIPPGSELPAWPAVGAGWTPHMSLSNQVELRGVLREQSMRFWEEIYDQYYQDPIPPLPK